MSVDSSKPSIHSGSIRKLKRGELLFAEGENSRAMYLIRKGIIRIFKKKGSSSIEIDSIHQGQILGELAFLDGLPRSASGQAMTDCELIEISGEAFTQTLSRMPDWLKIMLKTVVSRLRTASNRLRQLETASTNYSYSMDGRRGSHYVFLATTDVLKILTALLLTAARNGERSDSSIAIKQPVLNRYANQIMGVATAKTASLLEVLAQNDILMVDRVYGSGDVFVTDIDFIESAILYMNEQNLMEPTKRKDLSLKGFILMSYMMKHVDEYPVNAETGLANVNLAEIKKKESEISGKDPFKVEDIAELIKCGFAGALDMKSADAIFTPIRLQFFKQMYRLQKLEKSIAAANESSKNAAAA